MRLFDDPRPLVGAPDPLRSPEILTVPLVRAVRVVLAAALLCVAWQSLIPADDLLVTPSSDKAAHVGAYVVLGALAALSVSRRRGVAAWLGVVAFGLLLEIAQALSGYRSFEWLDLVADAVGAGLGVVVGVGALTLLKGLRSRASAG